MEDIFEINDIEMKSQLDSEYELEKASLIERQLRLMVKAYPELEPRREKLRSLIKAYEDRVWSDLEMITDEKVEESDRAEEIAQCELTFIKKRKDIIRKRLKAFEMTQQDLGVLLGHPKSYMSELMNGVANFTLKDLVIIHKVLGIDLNDLIPTFLHSETRLKVRESIIKLNKPKLEHKKMEFI